MIRRYGERVAPGQRYQLRPGAYAILWNAGELLTTYQDAPHFEFQLPGGGIDPGESALRALHREVFEETGWTIARPRRLGAYRRFAFMPEYEMWAEKICHIYLARPSRQISPPPEADHTAVWMSPDEALVHLENDGDRAFLADLIGF